MGVKKYNLAEQLWVPCAVKRYTSREEMNTSVWEQTYKGNTIKKNGANVALSINTFGGRGASVSTDQFYKDNCSIKLAENETYIISVTNNIRASEDAAVVVRYLDTNDIITSATYRDRPEDITLTPNVETYIYFGVDIPVGVAAVKEMATINVIRQSAWHDIDDFVRQNGAWVTEAIVSGALPLTAVKTTGEDILDYKIYGASGGVGDDSGTAYGYEVDMSITGNIYNPAATDPNNGYMPGYYMQATGEPAANNAWHITEYISIDSVKKYVVDYAQQGYYTGMAFYDLQKNYLSGQGYMAQKPFTLTVPQNAAYARFSIINSEYYQTPTIKESEIISIYLGSSPLEANEYVDYDSGKIYRMSGGTLTPTDPPVPLPALPTVDGTTIVDYAGQSAAVPSRFVAKYRKEGF